MTLAERLKGVRSPFIAAALVAGAAGIAGAQSATIRGRVTNEAGAPIGGANVFVRELNIGANSTAEGNYTIVVPDGRATGQRVTLSARFIGYTPQERPVSLTAGSQTQNFALKADPFRLESVVVTGVADSTSSRKLTFSVAHVSEDQIKAVPASSPVVALAGKVSGARISLGRGNPGAAPTIRLRGSTNLDVGGSTPLIIVDGVITHNSISDIDANEIASIEVLKGAAAASFYGSDAANGVINITTKRGKSLPDNELQVTVRSEYGQSDLPHMISLNHSHQYTVDADGNPTYSPKPDGFIDAPYPTTGPGRWRNQAETWLTNGQFYTTNVAAGMHRGNTNFNASFTNDHTQGTLPLTNGQFRQNFRVNVDQGLGPKADFSTSLTYGIQNNDYNPDGSQGIFALLQAPPNVDLKHPSSTDPVDYFSKLPNDPSSRGNPLYSLEYQQYNQRRERILGSISGRYRPYEWLRLEASYGTDRLNRHDRTYQFKGYYNTDGLPTKGSLDDQQRQNVAINQQVSATATRLLFGEMLSTTRAAALREENSTNYYRQGGSSLVTSLPTADAVDPAQNYVGSTETESRTIDYMISQAFDLKDRYLVDALYRRDGSSLFGSDNRWADFYRISGAYRITEDFHIPGFEELKLRAARGTAGLRPRFEAQYETYAATGAGPVPVTLGNKQLRPAVQTEDEYGVNATFLDRFDAEVVYAKRLTKGAFLLVPVSGAQTNGYQSQWRNAADVSAKTTELSLNTRVVDKASWGYNFTLTGDHTSQRIEKMEIAPFRVNAGGQGQNVFYYKEGEPLGIVYGTRFVHNFAQLVETCTAAPTTAGCIASPTEADYVVNPLGYLVRADRRGLPNEAPIKYVDSQGNTQFQIGNVNPDFSFGFANNIRYHKFNLYALFDGQKGGQVYNFNKQWMFQDYRSGDMDQAGKPQDQKIAASFYSGGLYNGLEADEYFVENASYVKLRELSLSYDVDRNLLNKVHLGGYAKAMKLALIGRNLHTWTGYSGFDPDVTSGGDFNFRIEGFRPPQFRTVTGQIEITF